jgi:hypothetical protein
VTSPTSALALATLLLNLAACGGLLPPARSSGARFSEEGVLLAVVGQSCKPSPAAQPQGLPQLEATLAIEVGNPSRGALTVDPARFLLVVGEGTPVPTSTTDAGPPASVEPGTTARFLVHFVARGACTQEMQLLPSSAIESRNGAINIAPVRFVPVEAR